MQENSLSKTPQSTFYTLLPPLFSFCLLVLLFTNLIGVAFFRFSFLIFLCSKASAIFFLFFFVCQTAIQNELHLFCSSFQPFHFLFLFSKTPTFSLHFTFWLTSPFQKVVTGYSSNNERLGRASTTLDTNGSSCHVCGFGGLNYEVSNHRHWLYMHSY